MSNTSREREIKIGDNALKYSFNVMGARQGVQVGTEIIKMVAPVFGAIWDDETNTVIGLDESNLFSQIAAHMIHTLHSDKICALIDLLTQGLHKGSHRVEWDDEFAGKYFELVTLVEYSLKENYGDFFVKYFKAKGFEIPTLEQLKAKAHTPVKLEDE
jgi:hypothetical protein